MLLSRYVLSKFLGESLQYSHSANRHEYMDDSPYMATRWCRFEATEADSTVIEYVILVVLFSMLALIIYARQKAKQQNQLGQINIVYKFIIVWLLCFLCKTTLNIIAYVFFMSKSPHKNLPESQTLQWDSENYQPLSQPLDEVRNQQIEINVTALRWMSGAFVFMDGTTTFFLQAAMMYIPYIWIKNSLFVLADESFSVDERKRINSISQLLSFIQKYMLFRYIYVIFLLIVGLFTALSDELMGIGRYVAVISTAETITIFLFYALGMVTFRILKTRIDLKENEKRTMLIEYVILLSCNLLRFFMNIFFYLSERVNSSPDSYCYDESDKTLNCLYLGFGLTLMHILPGLMILYVYWPSKRPTEDLKSSLLISNTEQKILISN